MVFKTGACMFLGKCVQYSWLYDFVRYSPDLYHTLSDPSSTSALSSSAAEVSTCCDAVGRHKALKQPATSHQALQAKGKGHGKLGEWTAEATDSTLWCDPVHYLRGPVGETPCVFLWVMSVFQLFEMFFDLYLYDISFHQRCFWTVTMRTIGILSKSYTN